jgi:hypothetical protein
MVHYMKAITYSFSPLPDFSIPSILGLLKLNYMVDTTLENLSHESSVNSQLRKMTADYIEKHPGLTLNALASRSGVPATTMRRLMQEEGRSELAPHSVLALVSYLLKEKKISKILKTISGPVADLLNKCFDQFIFDEKSSSHELSADLNTVFRDKTCYLVYKMAANVSGTSIDDIKNAFGLLGLTKLNEMVEKGWIISDEQGKLHAKEKNFSVDLALAHQLSHALLDLYKPSEVKAGYNLFYSLSEGMNNEGIQKIKEIEKEAVKKIYEIMCTKNMQGDIPYFALIVSDVMGMSPHHGNTEGVLQ